MAALEQVTKYKAEVMAGDLLVVKSKPLKVNDKTLRFIHSMFNVETGEEVATTETVAVHLDRMKRKGCSLPVEIVSRCEKIIQNDG
ncbi:MAG: thioesterase family protein [Candidatus Thiodiazotropha sp.]